MNYPVKTMRPDSTELISFAIDINGEKYLKKLNVRVTSVDGIIKDLIDEHHLVSDSIYSYDLVTIRLMFSCLLYTLGQC